MVKIKIFYGERLHSIQEQIDEFLKNKDIEYVDLKATSIISQYSTQTHTLTLVYKDKSIFPAKVGNNIITESLFKSLCDESRQLAHLKGAGVDNWDGYSYAMQEYWKEKGEL